jgi:putative phosphoesterase
MTHSSDDRTSVGLVSDTHGWVHPFLHEAFAGCECIVHAGDIGSQEVLDELETIAPVHAVKGNIDGGELRFLPVERVDEVAGKRIAVLHIAGNPRRPRPAARALIARERPDVLVVGHTHVPVVGRVGDTLWINPGAAGIEGHHDLRFAALLHIEADGELAMDRIHLGSRSGG